MSKKISIINAGNIYAQTLIKNLNGFNKVSLGDLLNNRRSLHYNINNLRKTDPSVTIEHSNISSPYLLEKTIKDSNTVVYFTHDYFSNVQDKNRQLLDTAELCKSYNISKVIAVTPIEYINYYNNDGFSIDPLNIETEAHDEAMKKNQNLTILRSNLVFGTRSYLIRYLTQNFLENIDAINNPFYKNYRFNPIYYNDLNDMIVNLINDEENTYKGKKLLANGGDSLSFLDIDNLLKQTYTSTEKSLIKKNKFLTTIFDNWQLFFHGNTHVTNFRFMLNFLQARSPQFTGYESANKLLEGKPKSLREYYVQKAEKFDDRINPILGEIPEDFRFPALQNYYKISLD